MLRRIRYFQTVVQTGSFSEAAAACHVSQSAISQQVQALERELGFALLERRNRRFALTPAGEYFYQKSLALIADFERMRSEAARRSGPGRSPLRLGFLRSYSGGELHRTVEAFSLRFPQTPLQITTGSHDELFELIRTDAADLILNDQRRGFSDEYVNIILAVVPAAVEISPRSPLAAAAKVSLQDLRNTPCILIASAAQHEIERAYYHDVIGVRSEFLFADSLDQARLMVSAGQGYLPVEDARGPAASASALPRLMLCRAGEPVKRTYCAFCRRDRANEGVADFADMLREQFGHRTQGPAG